MTRPRRAKTKPIFDLECVMRMFMGSVMVIPTPTAEPFRAPIVGLRECAMARVTLPPLWRTSAFALQSSTSPHLHPPDQTNHYAKKEKRESKHTYPSRCSVTGSVPPTNPISRSAPAQKMRPSPPVKTMHLTRSSISNMLYASSSSSIMVLVKALWFCGRQSVRMMILGSWS